jgi:hypothetical protein
MNPSFLQDYNQLRPCQLNSFLRKSKSRKAVVALEETGFLISPAVNSADGSKRGYQSAKERVPIGHSYLDASVHSGDRLGIFPTRMAMLVV